MKEIILSLLLLCLVFAPCYSEDQLSGKDKDEHGCLKSTGYQWCESTQKCQKMGAEYCKEYKEQFKIDSFDDCVAAGNPVMKSYPRKCMAGGTTFVEEIKFCAGKGEIIYNPLMQPKGPGKCCEGLYPISDGTKTGAIYCTTEECGNGLCRSGENPFNCPKDCPLKKIFPKKD